MRDESKIRTLAVEQERKAAKAKSKEKAAREEGATVQADAYGALASAYWREANLLWWALGEREMLDGNGCCVHREPEPEPRRLTVGDYVRCINATIIYNGQFAKILKDDVESSCLPYFAKFVGGREDWMSASEVAPATREEYDAAITAHEAKKAAEAKRAEEDALVGLDVVRVKPYGGDIANYIGRIGEIQRGRKHPFQLIVSYRISNGVGGVGWDYYTNRESCYFHVPRGDDPEPYAEAIKAAYEAATKSTDSGNL